MRVAVVGATGFVGSHLVPHLARSGHEVVAVSRHGRPMPGWPTAGVAVAAGDIETGEGLPQALDGADAVVHLVAIPREGGGRTFDAVNVRGVERVVRAAGEAGVGRFVHLSVLGVVDDPQLAYIRSKWLGEQVLRASGLDWVILRPSLLFGEGDGFFTLIRTTLTWWSPGVVAIPGDGSARFQPLSVDDLAIAIERCVSDPRWSRTVVELGGPEHLTYRQIVAAVMAVTGKRRLMLNMPIPLLEAMTLVTDRILPIFPVSHDQVRSLRTNNFTRLDAFESAFGIVPRPLDLEYLRG
jgi:uncharacterized protein YbjT (DUF2867 family)